MPIAKRYTALEHAVYECASVGCQSIWITVNDNYLPLIRKRLGDYVMDPVWNGRMFDPNGWEVRRIPIFYVPHLTKYRNKRASIGWGAVNSALYAVKVASKISNLAAPDRFYVSFPLGLYRFEEVREVRDKVRLDRPFRMVYDGKCVQDGLKLGFTFNKEDIQNIKENLKNKESEWDSMLDPNVPEHPWKYINEYTTPYTLEEIFAPVNMKDSNDMEVKWYYDISDWKGYREFMGSMKYIKKPKDIFVYKRLAPFGVNKNKKLSTEE